MATLGNLLARRGGVAMTGRQVKFVLALPARDGGAPTAEEAQATLFPVSEARAARAIRSAEAYCQGRQDFGDAPLLAREANLRFLCEAMRDSDDARKAFVEADHVDDLRESLVYEQLVYLLGEYAALIQAEYPECVTSDDFKGMKAEAKSLFTSGQG